jgi:transposase InsO family protein
VAKLIRPGGARSIVAAFTVGWPASVELIAAVLVMIRRDPRFGCPRIALEITHAFDIEINKDVVSRRIVGFGVEPRGIDGICACRMFNRAIASPPPPRYLSSDNDPLSRFHRWCANLRTLEINEIKTIPYMPISHPFVKRLIGTIRRTLLDQTFFWNRHDLQRKLDDFKNHYNKFRAHSSLTTRTPPECLEKPTKTLADLNDFS